MGQDLPVAQVSNLENAGKNAGAFMSEVLSKLKGTAETDDDVRGAA